MGKREEVRTLVECEPYRHVFVIAGDDKFGVVEVIIYDLFVCPGAV
jgi:hypothetical protein